MSPATRAAVRKCSFGGCDEERASVAFTDLVHPDGKPCVYAFCVDHELARYARLAAWFSYHESQLEAAQIASEGSR